MKTIRLAGALFFGLLWVSCHFTETIHLREDGSGTLALRFDGSEMMAFSDSSLVGSGEERLDSVIRFADVLREKQDSIRLLPEAEQQRLEQLRPYELRMVSDPEAGEFNFILSRAFRQIEEVGDAFAAFQDAGRLDPGKGETPMEASGEVSQSTEVAYAFRGNRFTRQAFITDSLLHRQRLDSLQGGDSFLAGSTYKLEVHFPRRVKSVSLEGATLSVDGKTLFYEVGFLDYLRKPDLLDLEVILEE